MTDTYCPSRDTKYPRIGDFGEGCASCQQFCCDSGTGCTPGVCDRLALTGFVICLLLSTWAFTRIYAMTKQKRAFCSNPLPLFYVGLVSFGGRAAYYGLSLWVENFTTYENRVWYDIMTNVPSVGTYASFFGLMWTWAGVLSKMEGLKGGFFSFYKRTLPLLGFMFIGLPLVGSWDWNLAVGPFIAIFVAPPLYIGFPWATFGVWKLSKEVDKVFNSVDTQPSPSQRELVERLTRLTKRTISSYILVSITVGICLGVFSSGDLIVSTPCEIIFWASRMGEVFLVWQLLHTMQTSRMSVTLTVLEPLGNSVKKVANSFARRSSRMTNSRSSQQSAAVGNTPPMNGRDGSPSPAVSSSVASRNGSPATNSSLRIPPLLPIQESVQRPLPSHKLDEKPKA